MRDAHARQLATNWEGFLECVPGKESTKAELSKAEHVKPQLGSVMALAKDTGRPRDECRAALIASQNDYDRAKASLMPDAILSQAPSGVAIEGVYEPAEKFGGGRPGWIFKAADAKRSLADIVEAARSWIFDGDCEEPRDAAHKLNEFVGLGYCDLGQMTASPPKAVALHAQAKGAAR
eukprot:jgi/Chrpa1/5644/Chrysochromulina_OHIO_Genome00016386-RA